MSVTWWIGNPSMLPFVLVFGLLVTRKIRHFELVYVFLVAAALMITLVAVLKGVPVGTQLLNAVKSGPLIFLATIMLTEPATMPSQHNWQLLFALLVGTLYASQLRLGIFSTSPHMVLAAGNIFAFVVSPAVKTRLRFKQKIMISPNVAEYIFTPSPHFNYIAGQYVDWTLPHKHVDGRGNRHTFTLASSPTESTVSLGVKFYTPSSTYKTALAALKPGDTISVGHISGNFIMPSDPSQKLVFIAGGIGITPFRSMVKYLTDTNQKRDITLFYASANPQEFAFMDVFKAAVSVGVKTVQILGGPPPPANWQGYTGQLTADILQKEVPDYKTRQYYISGPNGLVVAYKDLLKANGVKGTQIHTDYFSGY